MIQKSVVSGLMLLKVSIPNFRIAPFEEAEQKNSYVIQLRRIGGAHLEGILELQFSPWYSLATKEIVTFELSPVNRSKRYLSRYFLENFHLSGQIETKNYFTYRINLKIPQNFYNSEKFSLDWKTDISLKTTIPIWGLNRINPSDLTMKFEIPRLSANKSNIEIMHGNGHLRFKNYIKSSKINWWIGAYIKQIVWRDKKLENSPFNSLVLDNFAPAFYFQTNALSSSEPFKILHIAKGSATANGASFRLKRNGEKSFYLESKLTKNFLTRNQAYEPLNALHKGNFIQFLANDTYSATLEWRRDGLKMNGKSTPKRWKAMISELARSATKNTNL